MEEFRKAAIWFVVVYIVTPILFVGIYAYAASLAGFPLTSNDLRVAASTAILVESLAFGEELDASITFPFAVCFAKVWQKDQPVIMVTTDRYTPFIFTLGAVCLAWIFPI